MATDNTRALRAAKRESALTVLIRDKAASFGRTSAGYRMLYCDVDGVLFPNEATDGRCCYCGNALSRRESNG